MDRSRHHLGRNTEGVTFTRPDESDRIIAIARNVETQLEEELENSALEVEPANVENQPENTDMDDSQTVIF